ncbi:MAG TPA: beta-propeller domain-containing protein [Nitrososphaerales archaeon]|nr:beta-propeller domain-containing protein [Nitrososphaerales archaeon]
MSPRTSGENLAIVTVVLSLLIAGTVVLSVPYGGVAGKNVTNAAFGVRSTGSAAPTNRVALGPPDSADARSGTLSSFQTYSQLDDFITANVKSMQPNQALSTSVTIAGGIIASTTTMTTTATETAVSTTTVAAPGAGSTSSGPSYTTTNNQVQGVDELDIVKTDGTYLYVASSQAVSIIRAYPVDATSVVSTIQLPNFSVIGISLEPQRLAVLGQSLVNSSIALRLYNISDPAAPSLLNSLLVSGEFVGARTTQGYFYLVVQQPSFESGAGNLTAAYPTVDEEGVSSVLSPGSTYYAPNGSQVSVYTMVLSMSMSTGVESAVSVLTGPSSTIYVSASNIYVVYSNFYPSYADGIAGDVFNGGDSGSAGGPQQNSTVFRVAYSEGNVTVKASGSFPGGVLSQYSMNEYDSYFMVATSRSGTDDVFVLSQSLSQVGVIRNIAPGENIYAVRFEGDLGYVVTFEQVDPLFTISFANPANPVVLSALHVTGFSDYLHPFGRGYLVGVGKDTVNSSSGNFAFYLGLKLSLFNVTSADSTEVANYMIGARGTDSAVLDDPLAFTFDTTTNTMVIPVNLYTISGGQSTSPQCPGCPPAYGDFTWQGVYVFNVSTAGFRLLGTVTQNRPGQDPSTNQIDRSVIIGNVLYTVSQNEVMASSLSSFATLATVPLPQ